MGEGGRATLTPTGNLTFDGLRAEDGATATVRATTSGTTVTGRNVVAGEGAAVSIESAGDVTLTQETGELSGLAVKAKGKLTVRSPVAVRGWVGGSGALAIDDAGATLRRRAA